MQQRVLIVDDSMPIHELLKIHLEGESYRLDSAFDGRSALAAAAETPDVVLLDVDLPDMNGFEICRQLKANPKTGNIAVIFLTASQTNDERVWGRELNALDCITKPYDPEELRDRLRAALLIKRLHSPLADVEGELAIDLPTTSPVEEAGHGNRTSHLSC